MGPRIGTQRYHRIYIDNDESVRRALKRLIKVSGFKAKTFGSAREFIDSGHYQGTGVLVLDVRMPGMSGLELQKHVTDSGSDMPIIFITAVGWVDPPKAEKPNTNIAFVWVVCP